LRRLKKGEKEKQFLTTSQASIILVVLLIPMSSIHFRKENVEQLFELISIVDIKQPIENNLKDFVSKAEEFRVEAESKFHELLKKLDKAADEVFNAYSENPRDINDDKPEDRQMYDEYMTQDGFFRYLNSMLPQNIDEPYEI
jgi:GTP-binding protein EngB required for normal cell division